MLSSVSSALAANLNLGKEFYSGEAGFALSGEVQRPTGLTVETVAGRQIGTALFLIPAKGAEISCAKGVTTEGFIENEYENFKTGAMSKGAHGQGTAVAEECKVNSINAKGEATGELKSCSEVLDGGSRKVIGQGLGLIKRHEGLTYGILVPRISSKASAEEAENLTLPFTTLTFGGTCSLPATINITGSVGEVAPKLDAVKPKQSVNTFSEAGKKEQELLGTKLNFGSSPAFIAGEGEAELTGTGKSLASGAM
jgi:hypothetical protein